VGLLSSATAVHRDHMRVIEVAFEFVEAGASIFPATIIATIISVLAAADSGGRRSWLAVAGAARPGMLGTLAALVEAMAAACRRAVLASLTRASAFYQPVSYEDRPARRSAAATGSAVGSTRATRHQETVRFILPDRAYRG
jgi:hypothetical protein